MTRAGWVMMLISLGIVWTWVIWAYWKLLSTPRDKEEKPESDS